MQGQRDQAEFQGKSQKQAAEAAARKQAALQEELTALEEKRFDGLDVPAMQERLVELSARYEEVLRDSSGREEQGRLSELRAKIARSSAEQDRSMYTDALAEAGAWVKHLAARYQQEGRNYKLLSAGNLCPTCHRSIPAEALPLVQAEIKKAVDAILVEGKAQRAQLVELQEMDKKSAEAFKQFKAEDLAKWSQEADELEAQCQKQSEAAPEQAEALRQDIHELSAAIVYGNLTQEEFDLLKGCREELRQCAADLKAVEKAVTVKPEDVDGQITQAKLLLDPFEKISTHIVILGLELIAVSVRFTLRPPSI